MIPIGKENNAKINGEKVMMPEFKVSLKVFQIILIAAVFLLLNYSLQFFLGWISNLFNIKYYIYMPSIGVMNILFVLVLIILVSKIVNKNIGETMWFLGIKRIESKHLMLSVLLIIPIIIGSVSMYLIYFKDGASIKLIFAWPYYLLLFVTSASFEEVFFRGFLFRTLRVKKSFIIAALVSSLLWSVCHLSQLASGAEITRTLVVVATAFVLGFFYCYIFENTTMTIWSNIIFHIFFNSISALIDVNNSGTYFTPTGLAAIVYFGGIVICLVLVRPVTKWLIKTS